MNTPQPGNFYPRSPCGERPPPGQDPLSSESISIHALLAESDASEAAKTITAPTISIHALLAESDVLTVAIIQSPLIISIHALLAESDLHRVDLLSAKLTISIHALLAESDFLLFHKVHQILQFLSTLSLRRATLCGEDSQCQGRDFYPRSPCGERLICTI